MKRILIADDDKVSRCLLQAHLTEWGNEVTSVENGRQALDVLRTPNSPRLAILDWMMPDIDGIEVCRQIRQGGDEAFTYIIILTAKSQKQDIVTALNSGADDFLTKPYDMDELRSRIHAGKRVVDLQLKLKAANEQLEILVRTDPLTHVANRMAIMEHLNSELARQQRRSGAIAALMCDLDNFKRINDTHGHLCGDEVLVEVARRLDAVCRSYDMVGRYGGEEFLVVSTEIPACAIEGLGERFLQSINRVPFNTFAGALTVTASMGLIWAPAEEKYTSEAIIRSADALLYEAKKRGKNQIVCAVAPGSIETE